MIARITDYSFVTGRSLLPQDFDIPEFHESIPQMANEVLRGKALGLCVRNYLSPEECDRITMNFDKNLGLRDRDDEVRARTVGIDLFGKSRSEYLAALPQARSNVEDLFRGAINVSEKTAVDLQRLLPKGCAVRPAEYLGNPFSTIRAIEWTGTGDLALKYHDDKSQNLDPRLRGFEVGDVVNPVAINIYPQVPTKGGELVIMNIDPDMVTKRRLGVERSGYPYESAFLDGIDRIELEVRQGDLVMLCGSFLHGVNGITGTGRRLLLNQFVGFVDQGTIVRWS